MKGFPKHFNTKADVLYSLDRFPDETRAYLQRLLDEKDQWLTVAKLADGDAGTTDATHRVLEVTDGDGVVTERYQQEFREDPNGPIFRLGFASSDDVTVLVEG